MNRDCIIYKITNNITSQIYIGSSIVIKDRIRRHFKDLKANKHHSLKMQRSYNKYGKESFHIEYLITVPEQYRQKIEQWFLDNNECYFNNEKIVGKPSIGRIRSEEEKEKLRKRMLGNELWKLNKPMSKEGRESISKSSKNRKWTKEQKEKLSIAKLGNLGRKGQPHKESTKQKISINSPKKKKVLQFELNGNFIKKWDSVIEAAKTLNISKESIQSCCNNKNKTGHGYIWRYIKNKDIT
jgi:group I intron endonuclease